MGHGKTYHLGNNSDARPEGIEVEFARVQAIVTHATLSQDAPKERKS